MEPGYRGTARRGLHQHRPGAAVGVTPADPGPGDPRADPVTSYEMPRNDFAHRRGDTPRIRWRGFSFLSGLRTDSGADTTIASIWAPAWILAFIAPRRATRSTQIIST